MFRLSLVRALTCVTGLILAAVWADPATAARPMGQIMADAVKARDAGDLDRTVELLREAYAVQPAPEILNNLGKILEQLGRYREAVDAYQKVADDPTADAQLRSLDTSRVAALQPKMNRAWVLPKISPDDAMIYVDGRLIDLPPGVEFPTSHRKHVVLVVHPDEKQAVVRYTRFPLERRTDFIVDLNAPGSDSATLTIPRDETPQEIRVNGKALGDGIRRLRNLRMPAGSWDLEVTTADGKRHSGEVTLAPGATAPLPLDEDAFEAASAPQVSDGGDASVDAGLSASSSSEPSAIGPLLPWTGVAAGAVGTTVGVAMLMAASTAQSELDSDLSQGDGNLWLLNDQPTTFSPISYKEAQARQDAINADSQMAGIITALGSAVLVGSTVWAVMGLMEDGAESPPASGESAAQLLFSPNGVTLTGRF